MELLSSSEVTRLSRNPCNYTRTRMVITMFARIHHMYAVDTLISFLFRDNFGTALLFKFAYIKSSAVGDFRYVDLFLQCESVDPKPGVPSFFFFQLSANTYSKCWQVGCNRNDVETILL